MTALIETREVSRFYGTGAHRVVALDRVSVAVRAGEFVALQGTSGSGKSTLLNLLGGLDAPSAGEVFFAGRPLALTSKKEMARYRRDSVGMIFQNFNLIQTMSAGENVALALAFAGRTRAEREPLARDLLARTGLAERVDHKPNELSGGEQQRVAIARAMANRPRLLLADEPTGNLDSARAGELLALLRGMVEGDAMTVIMVTHDRELAARFADRTIYLKDGRVQETG